jgi:galactokinase
MMDLTALVQKFGMLYGTQPRLFRAPGRVNLIGEHTDYNDGFVLPMAIKHGTVVAGAKRADRRVRVHSLNFNESAEFDLDRPGNRKRGVWLDYVEGVAQALLGHGLRLSGADLALTSDIPIGGGLSSSAALEMSVGTALVGISGEEINRITLALAGQEAEHNYVGMKCGIMDQFIASMGKAGHALLIDCRKLEGTLIPLGIKNMTVVVCDTRVKHALASSEYNTRRGECEQGVSILREVLPGVRALRDVKSSDLDRFQERFPKVVLRRCRHVVSENERTLAAVKALQAGDAEEMGRLMAASHKSLRDDYEVSCRELDILVESAQSVPGVAGARMTGGGFGGCTVNLVSKDALEVFSETVLRDYLRTAGQEPLILPVQSSDCAAEIIGREFHE